MIRYVKMLLTRAKEKLALIALRIRFAIETAAMSELLWQSCSIAWEHPVRLMITAAKSFCPMEMDHVFRCRLIMLGSVPAFASERCWERQADHCLDS